MTFENEFGRFERLLHLFAFRTGFPQTMLADMEDLLFADTIASVTLDQPVFISGLPRSGTTIILKLLAESGHFAAHTYQDMPFVLCPLLWSRFSRRFSVERAPRERAHGDGLKISAESPEAFEEIVWKQFWGSHYHSDRIEPWTTSDHDEEFNRFFENHMEKIIAVRRHDAGERLRYLSKNNVNIARLGAPPKPLQRGIFLIPFRSPFQHAASMLRQHRRFSRLQSEDAFARRYMEGIGHHDFGLELRPINFGGWLDEAGSPDGIEFWLRYWTATYRHVLTALRSSRHLLSYARLTSEPESTLGYIANSLGIPPEDLVPLATRLRAAREVRMRLERIDRGVSEEARAVYDELEKAERTQT